MMILNRIIPTSFIRWVENLPEWVLMAGVGCVILLVIVAMWLLIRKLNAQDSHSAPKQVPAKPPVARASKPAAPTVPKMPPKPVPPRPVPPAATPAVQSIPEIDPVFLEDIAPAPAPIQPAPTAQSQQEIPSIQESAPPVKPAPVPAAAPAPKPVPPRPVQPAAVPAPEPSLDSPEKTASQQPPVLDPAIYKKIAALGGSNKSVLFAGAGLEHLPVTIPVQTAVKLAGGGKKILLIDLDMRRNAIAKVFDPSETTVKNCPRPKPLPSPVENLSFWPADFFVRFAQMNLRMVTQSAAAQFDLILINAPYLDGHPDRKLIASCSKYALIFCKTKPQFERLQTLMTMGECQLLESKPIEC